MLELNVSQLFLLLQALNRYLSGTYHQASMQPYG